MDVDMDKKKASISTAYVQARYNLGCVEFEAGNEHRAYKHFILSARAGDMESLDKAKQGFVKGYVTKDEYAKTLRAYQ